MECSHCGFRNREVEHYREALALADRLEMRPLVARCHFCLGLLHRAAHRDERARKHLGIARELFREMGMQAWLAKIDEA